MAAEESRARPPHRRLSPRRALLVRGLIALGLLVVVALTVWLGREGFVDDTGGEITLLDAMYYASVTTTTTGYGDITPVTPAARLATTIVVTPARVGFLLLLVGTTVELLTERWRAAHRRDRWRRRVKDHYLICGFGVKGRSAARALLDEGVDAQAIVVVEEQQAPAAEANAEGYTVVIGDASRAQVLQEARADRATAVIVGPDRDDAAVLITLTARELAPQATIVAAVQEEENAHLLRQSGADATIVSAETSGRLLGLTSRNPRIGAIVTDLLHTAHGLALTEREVNDDEVGHPIEDVAEQVTFAVVRGNRLLRHDDPDVGTLQAGDRLLGLSEDSRG